MPCLFLPTANTAVGLFYPFHSSGAIPAPLEGIYTDFSSAKYARFVAPFTFSESTELHRISLRFKFMIVRLMTEGDALTLKLL